MISIDTKDTPVPKLHQYLLGAIAPRPIAFASTIDAQGRPNLAPFSFFNVFSVKPPIVIFSPARRGRDNTTKHTYENALAVKECVINIVNYDMVQQMSLTSAEFPEGVNEFEKSGLTPLASELVRPFRVAESPVQMECKINEVLALGNEGGAGNLIICEVLRIHMDEKIFDDLGRISPYKIDTVSRLGGSYYSRARNGLFELPQPSNNLGIGFDQLPADVRSSSVLTGNDLGQLASVQQLPDETSVNEYKLLELDELFMENENDSKALELRLHEKAKELLSQNNIDDAWRTLLTYNN
ncbi:MAG: flavin reductase family protein [Flavobacteriales bacterium]|nr:flavin reductase family protein [Flavobacteriales bacterium]